MSSKKVLEFIKKHNIQYVDLRFTNTHGKEQHVTQTVSSLDQDHLEEGKWFDGSSIAGWKAINESDMLLRPDLSTAVLDPFYTDPTLLLRCDVLDPKTRRGYNRDPRSIARRAEAHLKKTKIADNYYLGPEPEFFVFDNVLWSVEMGHSFYRIESDEAAWSTGERRAEGGLGHRPGVKGGYFPVPPVDSLQDIRSAMCTTLEEVGVPVEVHHHEVGTAGQCEIGTKFSTLVKRADQNQLLKYVVLNVAQQYGKTATFMPKPLVGENGNGMHIHMSMFKNGKNLFSGKEYAGLSKTALYFIGGIIKHARAVNAFSNAATNSYKRLVPGFEAPTMLAYSADNRSASIRIPHVLDAKSTRIEVRFPDAAGNPYLTFSAMLMAGLDGIKNKMHPGDPTDRDLYEMSEKQASRIPHVCASLDEALDALQADHKFLLEGGVFDKDALDGYIELKRAEVSRLHRGTHPVEYDMYYSC